MTTLTEVLLFEAGQQDGGEWRRRAEAAEATAERLNSCLGAAEAEVERLSMENEEARKVAAQYLSRATRAEDDRDRLWEALETRQRSALLSIDTLREDNDRLRAALEQVEWLCWTSGCNGEPILCPWCKRTISEGHSVGCPRQRALRVKP